MSDAKAVWNEQNSRVVYIRHLISPQKTLFYLSPCNGTHHTHTNNNFLHHHTRPINTTQAPNTSPYVHRGNNTNLIHHTSNLYHNHTSHIPHTNTHYSINSFSMRSIRGPQPSGSHNTNPRKRFPKKP